jgi:hypothetical protein
MRILSTLLLIFAVTASPTLAADLTLQRLAGWWLAIDQVAPDLWARPAHPTEELLVIDPSGRADTRVMRFVLPDPIFCLDNKPCSDAPILQSSAVTVRGDTLSFGKPEATAFRIMPLDPASLRAAAATSTPAWLARLTSGDRVLILERFDGASPRRIFARVGPATLGRLRAGFFQFDAAVVKSWRCWLAHAAAGDPGFAAIARPIDTPPGFDTFLKAATYRAALDFMSKTVPPDAPKPDFAEIIGLPMEMVLSEPFPDLRPATTMAESNRLWAMALYLAARADGATDAEAIATARKNVPDANVTLGISEAEITALASAKTDPALSKMLVCD